METRGRLQASVSWASDPEGALTLLCLEEPFSAGSGGLAAINILKFVVRAASLHDRQPVHHPLAYLHRRGDRRAGD